jgi:uncharacterized protein YndB with AHSA1/START domain
MAIHIAEITTQASTQKVFEALTNPELVKLWQYGRVVMTDWKIGSKIEFRSEGQGDLAALEQWGTILDIRPNEFIKYSLFTPRSDLEDKTENDCVTSYEISDDGESTKVKLIQEDKRPSGFVSVSLKPILAALKRVAETN